MSILQATTLGVLQGLGEFLPISSSGHLIVIPWLLGWPEHGLAFDVALHLGTLAAVLYAFIGDWWRLVASALRGLAKGNPFAEAEGRLLGLIAVASVPGAVAGLLFEEWADTVFRSPALVACTMGALGLLLLAADRIGGNRGGADTISASHALLIGIAQAAAIVPGVSRSGATISMARLLGYRREEAARFSFLLATPITFGAALVKVPKLVAAGGSEVPLAAGMVAAAVVGLLSIRVLLTYVRTRDYSPFAYYRFAFAIIVGAALLFHR
jgi:undecaprenyl-diphosphatase